MTTMMQNVGAAILLAEVEWSPKSTVSKETAMARAALEAMREPTEAMVWAATERYDAFATSDAPTIYTAMIDVALQEPPAQ